LGLVLPLRFEVAVTHEGRQILQVNVGSGGSYTAEKGPDELSAVDSLRRQFSECSLARRQRVQIKRKGRPR